ncbi:MAG: type II secretion system F family protein [Thermoguttaceae bacterium]|jgi:Flp pilus assembly protein TadB
MAEILLCSGLLLVGVGVVAAGWRNARARTLARGRMENRAEVSAPAQPEQLPVARSFLVRYRLLPWMLGLAAAGLLYFALGWAPPFVIAVGLIAGLLSGQLESYLAMRRTARIETQLADAIDLMVAALGAGAGVTDALDGAMHESRRPLRPQLEDVVGRIRFGDDPRTVYHGLTERVPLETFLLFASALGVQSETGGSLAPTLASVGRTIRDRIEIARRIRSNSAQSEVSTLAVMLLTYFIALVVWRTNPEQMSQFLATSVGQWAVAGTILLQALGLVWMAFISRLRF